LTGDDGAVNTVRGGGAGEAESHSASAGAPASPSVPRSPAAVAHLAGKVAPVWRKGAGRSLPRSRGWRRLEWEHSLYAD
jgi:hypothetical protein